MDNLDKGLFWQATAMIAAAMAVVRGMVSQHGEASDVPGTSSDEYLLRILLPTMIFVARRRGMGLEELLAEVRECYREHVEWKVEQN